SFRLLCTPRAFLLNSILLDSIGLHGCLSWFQFRMPGFKFTDTDEAVCVPSLTVLVTGATGLLGRAVYREFQNNGWLVIGTGYRRARPRLLCCDLTDEDAVKMLIHNNKPDVIVHCAAERRPDVVERHTEAAVNLNVHATATLAKEAAAAGVFFLYISSDYVFDGRNPPYGEDDSPNPLNLYGRSKLEGERETLRHCPGTCLSTHLFVHLSTYLSVHISRLHVHLQFLA
ncbi:hypothetical protein LDENG_00245520, partial [Lucifuga dentata]